MKNKKNIKTKSKAKEQPDLVLNVFRTEYDSHTYWLPDEDGYAVSTYFVRDLEELNEILHGRGIIPDGKLTEIHVCIVIPHGISIYNSKTDEIITEDISKYDFEKTADDFGRVEEATVELAANIKHHRTMEVTWNGEKET